MTTPPPPAPLECLELDHVVLRVRDQAASQRFYTEVLGLTLDHVNEPIRLIQLRCGRHLIDLLPLGPGEPPAPTARLDHVCLSVRCEDLGAVVAYLRGRGVQVEGDAVSRRGAFGEGPSIYIRDPDGYRVELKPRQA
ncbi:MAG: VOC family protein [Candidatus Rokubacteria bacterium]|nr:VOC family protein [Candidatus Rokubacteria bacterium]